MSKEEVKQNITPVYTVEEEEEEELMTIDFENKKVYSSEENVVLVKDGKEIANRSLPNNFTSSTFPPYGTPPLLPISPSAPLPYITGTTSAPVKSSKPSFKEELQDVLLNTITSKAIGSLLKKQNNLDTKIDKLMYDQRMGKLGAMIDNEIDTIMQKRRRELRNCYAGSIVKYDHIPDWAHQYVKDYTRDMIHSLSIIIEEE